MPTAPASPTTAARAPGRVTLIGDHTDYNEGLSLPMAIDLTTEASFTPTPGSFLVRMTSDQFPESSEIPLLPLRGSEPVPRHAELAAGLLHLSHLPSGGSLSITSTIPVGAGLSSSAAFSVAVLLALWAGDATPPDPVAMATLCQSAEAAAGSHVGPLDPLAIMSGHATLIDFHTLAIRPIPIPADAAFVVVHCGVARELATSHYADRRSECEMAANHIGRPLGLCELGDLAALSDPIQRRRARHVITECARVREVERLLSRGNLKGVGAVMTEGHRSLADDYKCSIPSVDELVQRLLKMEGVYGARMSGGGFGGCVIALCAPDSPALDPATHAPLQAWRVSPAPGAALLVTG
jgi:galactokinase